MRYVSEAALRIFRRSDDDYPNTGVQPFEGTPPKGSKWDKWKADRGISSEVGKDIRLRQ